MKLDPNKTYVSGHEYEFVREGKVVVKMTRCRFWPESKCTDKGGEVCSGRRVSNTIMCGWDTNDSMCGKHTDTCKKCSK